MCLAIPGKVMKVDGMQADVAMFGLVRQVYIGLVPDARPGEYLLVHAGSAISKVEAAEAAEIEALLAEVDRRAREA